MENNLQTNIKVDGIKEKEKNKVSLVFINIIMLTVILAYAIITTIFSKYLFIYL